MSQAFNKAATRRLAAARAVVSLSSALALAAISCSRAHWPRPAAVGSDCRSDAPAKAADFSSGCAKAQSLAALPPSNMQPPADDHPLAPNTGRLAGTVRVVSFDCFSNKEGKRDASMRAWNAGGPSGAVWNIDGAPLVCKVTLDAPCGGSTELLLFGNRTALGKAVFNVTE